MLTSSISFPPRQLLADFLLICNYILKTIKLQRFLLWPTALRSQKLCSNWPEGLGRTQNQALEDWIELDLNTLGYNIQIKQHLPDKGWEQRIKAKQEAPGGVAAASDWKQPSLGYQQPKYDHWLQSVKTMCSVKNVTVGELNVEAQLHDLINQKACTRQPANLRLDSQTLETLLPFLITLLLFLDDCAGHVTAGFTAFQTIAVGWVTANFKVYGCKIFPHIYRRWERVILPAREVVTG